MSTSADSTTVPLAPIVGTDDLTAYLSGDPQAAIDAATGLVRDYCGWHVTPVETQTLTFRARGERAMLLPSLRVVAVRSVVVDGVPVDVDGIEWDPSGILWLGGVTGQVEAVVDHGFDEVPALVAVILAAAARMQAAPDGATSVKIGTAAVTYSQTAPGQSGGVALTDSERSQLDRYRLQPRP